MSEELGREGEGEREGERERERGEREKEKEREDVGEREKGRRKTAIKRDAIHIGVIGASLGPPSTHTHTHTHTHTKGVDSGLVCKSGQVPRISETIHNHYKIYIIINIIIFLTQERHIYCTHLLDHKLTDFLLLSMLH